MEIIENTPKLEKTNSVLRMLQEQMVRAREDGLEMKAVLAACASIMLSGEDYLHADILEELEHAKLYLERELAEGDTEPSGQQQNAAVGPGDAQDKTVAGASPVEAVTQNAAKALMYHGNTVKENCINIKKLLLLCIEVMLEGKDFLCDDIVMMLHQSHQVLRDELREDEAWLAQERNADADADDLPLDESKTLEARELAPSVARIERYLKIWSPEWQRKILAAVAERQGERDEAYAENEKQQEALNGLLDAVDGWSKEKLDALAEEVVKSEVAA